MDEQELPTLSSELTELRDDVARWRELSGGGPGTKIPEELWDRAVRVARVEGLWKASSALRFDYTRLKARLENNIVERALKKAIRHRNASLFFLTAYGAEVGDGYMTLIHTSELNGVTRSTTSARS
jgi:hypothetical protein